MTEQDALKRLMIVCAKGEHCCQEMREKMWKWGIDTNTQEKIVNQLLDRQFINEERFCRAFVNDKIVFNRWGKRKIEAALYQKRIDKSIINAVLAEIDNQSYVEQLQPLIASKRKQMKAELSDYEVNQRLLRFAIGRGYTYDVIKLAIGNVDNIDDIIADSPADYDEAETY